MASNSINQPWQPPPHVRPRDDSQDAAPMRPRTPRLMSADVVPNGPSSASISGEGGDGGPEFVDPRLAAFREVYARSEANIARLFGGDGGGDLSERGEEETAAAEHGAATRPDAPPKKPARTMDEDDYDDYDDDNDDDDDQADAVEESSPPLKSKTLVTPVKPAASAPASASASATASSQKHAAVLATPAQEQGKTSEEVRRRLEEDKKAAEDAARRSFHTLFYTLENDRDAMLEQQRLDELDRQVDAEMSHNAAAGHGPGAHAAAAGTEQQGRLSSANLGASSLTLKHLIARIDAKRDQVRASDAELRSLMSEVRKNRSKWANEDRVGQEELYEAAEKVLSELKAMTEHSTAFLTRVNKRDAPDYHNVIKHPMDLGSMTKKLKSLAYKSKQDFVDDINLIWSNCLKYNADPSHFLRKHALAMRKETDKLVPLIPDIVIRDRAEVEAEERRMQNGGVDGEPGEESDDEPIMSSRGRKAPGKKAKKGGSTGRKAPGAASDDTPGAEARPSLHAPSSATLKGDFLRADSDAPMDGSQNGLSTPPLAGMGSITPAGVNGLSGSLPPGSQADALDVDGCASSVNGLALGHGPAGQDEAEHEDLEYKTWKQVTKKDRALVAAERNRLFRGDRLNPDEPALLRTKAGMRRWLRNQRLAAGGAAGDGRPGEESKDADDAAQGGETLAEGMEGEEEDRVLPDYYDTLSAIPEMSERLRWVEDAEGQVVDQSDEFLRVVPKGHFTAPPSALSARIEANMRQMQETRKVCSKIGVIKQMQLQSQMYQNQFQKYQPEPFVEQDIGPLVVSDDGPIMSPWVCRAAMQRAVGKIFYHAGFEEFQPSALDAVTDIASDFFQKLARTLGVYRDAPKVAHVEVASAEGEVGVTATAARTTWRDKFTTEETILHCLHENGLDVESLENYVKDDVERLGTKLGVMHERMKAHLADLLRPALTDAGPDGSNAFNDGSEQFVGGDFAEELDEDFFGFKELGLDREFSLPSLGVPLHLLQNRMHNAYQAQNPSSTAILTSTNLEPLPPHAPVTLQSLKSEIGLIQNFFLAKLHANNDEPLVEDDELPQKQRFPKPRLPPTGKISSPRKRPLKEQQQAGNKSKKKKTEHAVVESGKGGGGDGVGKGGVGKLKLALPGHVEKKGAGAGVGEARESDKEDGGPVGMMSPESIVG
ncbi:MAG: Transcriptional activator spt7 [Thelocarpon impressellum]|nr:MAG: Transcriptional activator spt7 [Thelocarpon impressellum]